MCGYGGMADTSASGADGSNTVQVQVLLSAPKFYRGVAQFGSFKPDRRLRRIKGGRKGAAVEILRQTERKFRAPQV